MKINKLKSLLSAVLLIVLIGLLIGPIPQPDSYHDFADQRILLGVANGWNVFSNALFAIAGVWGLFLLFSHRSVPFVNSQECLPWAGVAIGLILTAIGSSYYHLAPDNSRLVWDRLPMTIIFMSLVAALIVERVDTRLGLWLWPLLLVIGFFSVFHWQINELKGASDLRFYLGVQIFTLITLLIMLLAPSPYTHTSALALVILFYALGRLFEIYDHQIWNWTKKSLSGHTLKHLSTGMAGIVLMCMIGIRKIKK